MYTTEPLVEVRRGTAWRTGPEDLLHDDVAGGVGDSLACSQTFGTWRQALRRTPGSTGRDPPGGEEPWLYLQYDMTVPLLQSCTSVLSQASETDALNARTHTDCTALSTLCVRPKATTSTWPSNAYMRF